MHACLCVHVHASVWACTAGMINQPGESRQKRNMELCISGLPQFLACSFSLTSTVPVTFHHPGSIQPQHRALGSTPLRKNSQAHTPGITAHREQRWEDSKFEQLGNLARLCVKTEDKNELGRQLTVQTLGSAPSTENKETSKQTKPMAVQ